MQSRYTEKKKCKKKKSYNTFDLAEVAKNNMVKYAKPIYTMQVYQCSICGKYHFGRAKTANMSAIERLENEGGNYA